MKSLRLVCLNAALIGTFALGNVFAASHPLLKAAVPFSFEVGGVALPAGEYQFEVKDDPSVVIVSDSHRAVAMMPVAAGTNLSQETARLTFTRNRNGELVLRSLHPGTPGEIAVQ